MQVSIIIPTYNRTGDLSQCLDSIIMQSQLPGEVIIVDNGDNDEAKNLIENRNREFEERDVSLKYIKNERENSLTVAKNIGVQNTTWEIIVFLDDDIILDKNYLKEILRIYQEYPAAVGVEGFIEQEELLKIRNTAYKIFFLYHLERNRCRTLPTGCVTYPYELDSIIPCQWLSGASSYKKQILEEFKFDEKLKKYSDGEDLEFSYRVFKRYPGALYLTPYARLIHKTSPAGRIPNRELIYMREVYGLYLFYKFFNTKFQNKFIYVWSRVGRTVLTLARAIIKQPPGIMTELRYLMGAYYFSLRHIREIRRGELGFFNNTLKMRKQL
jgi:GT2 family glycosyltransferase